MSICWKWLLALSATCGAASCQAAEIKLLSACDFMEASMLLKGADNSNEVRLDVTLTPEAGARMEHVSRTSIHKEMTMIIDGKPISTARVKGVIGTKLSIILSRQIAQELLPEFLAEPTPGACTEAHSDRE